MTPLPIAPEPEPVSVDSPLPATPLLPVQDSALPATAGNIAYAQQDTARLHVLRDLAMNPAPPARIGKIARLPEETRVEVNHLLRHGMKYAEISAHLAKLGYPGISVNNISNWKQGGFIDWYRDMQAREAALTPLKALERCGRTMDIGRWQQNAILMAAEQFALIMAGVSHERMIRAIHEKPELFPQYITAMASLSRCSFDLAKACELICRQDATLRHDLDLGHNAPKTEPEGDPECPSQDACPASSPVQSNPGKSSQIQAVEPIQPPSRSGAHGPKDSAPKPLIEPNCSAATLPDFPGLVNNLLATMTDKINSRT